MNVHAHLITSVLIYFVFSIIYSLFDVSKNSSFFRCKSAEECRFSNTSDEKRKKMICGLYTI